MPARFVFVALTLHADGSGQAWPSIERLMTETGLSRRTVQTALVELTAAGDLAVTRGGGRGNTNVFAITAKGCSSYTVSNGERAHQARQRVQLTTVKGAGDAPEGIRKDLEGARAPLPDDVRARNVAGARAAKQARREAMRRSR